MDVENTNDINTEEIQEDDYLIQLHRYLQERKEIRKRAEQDANLLDGRLRCLRGEEEKTLRKIEVTRKKMETKTNYLEEQENMERRKEKFRQMKMDELERKKELNYHMKESNKMAILLKQEELRKIQEDNIKLLKEQKKNNEELRKYMEIECLSNKKTQADYIKSQYMMAEEKKRAVALEKKNRVKMELERKIEEEDDKIFSAESRRKKLEEEEVEIMQKIKTTTQRHEALIETYEKLSSQKSGGSGNEKNDC